MKKYMLLGVNAPKTTLILGLLFVMLASVGSKNIRVESDYEVFFDEMSPLLEAHYDVEDTFGRNDFLQLAITPKQGDIFQEEVMHAIETISEDFWTLPYSRRVDSITNFPYTQVTGDDLNTSPLFEQTAFFSDAQWQERKQFALTNVATQTWLVSADGRVGGITATILLPEGDNMAPVELARHFEKKVALLTQQYPELNFHPYGSILINKEFFSHATSGFAKLLAVGIALLLLCSGLILRSALASICIGISMAAAVFSGLGITGWLQIPLTAPSSSAPVIVMAISVASTIHLLAGFLKRFNLGDTQAGAVRSTILENFSPIALTSLTTIAGFLCLNISDVPPYRLLGNTAAIGVAAAFLLSFSLLPALLVLMPFKQGVAKTNQSLFWANIGKTISRKPKFYALISLVFIILFSLPITRNVIDDRLLTYFDTDVKIRTDTEYVMEHFSFFYGAFMPAPSGEYESVTHPEYLQKLDDYLIWARAQPEVKTISGFSDVVKQLNKNMHADDNAYYRIPDQQSLIAQYILLYEFSLPFGKDLSNQIDSGKTSSLIRIGFHNVSSAQMRAFETRSDIYLATHFPSSMQTHMAGPPILFAHIWDDATRSNLQGMGVAVLLICVLIGLALKSIKLGFISLIPNIVPAIMAFGLWGLLKGQIDIGSSIVAVIAFGIIVDDSIHFLHRYEYFTKQGLSYQDTIEQTFASVGQALFTTTVVLCLGFGVLAFSQFTLNSSMGLLTSITIVLALLMDFIFLPAFLGLIDRRHKLSTPAKP